MADEKNKEKSGFSLPIMIAYTLLIAIIVSTIALGIGYKMMFKKPADLRAKTDIKAIAEDPESEVAVDYYKKLTIDAKTSVLNHATVRVPIDKLTFNLTSTNPKQKSFLVCTLEIVLIDYYTLMKLNSIEDNPKNAKMWTKLEEEAAKKAAAAGAKGKPEMVTKQHGAPAKDAEPMPLKVKSVFDEENGTLMSYLNIFIPSYTSADVMKAEIKEEIKEKIKEKINEILEHHSKGLGQCSEVNIVKWVVS